MTSEVTPSEQSIQKLREAASRATPGEWRIGFISMSADDKAVHRKEDYDFIAAANPQTILALLDEREQLRQQLQAALAQQEKHNAN